MLIDPDAFEVCFTRWVQSWARGVAREVVAVDGKTVRRSGSRRHDHGPLHVVSAWASEQGLALGQRAVDGKSNEIVAIPELLETLHLEGSVRARASKHSLCSRTCGDVPSRGFQDGQHRHGAAEELESAAIGGNVLVWGGWGPGGGGRGRSRRARNQRPWCAD